MYLANMISKVECPTCSKIFYYPLFRSCFHCGRNTHSENIIINKFHDFYISMLALSIIFMSYMLPVVRGLLDVFLFSLMFLSLAMWNYYFKTKYKTQFVLPLKLRFYLLVPLISVTLLPHKLDLWMNIVVSLVLVIFFGFLFAIKCINWMELSTEDISSARILNFTTIGDHIKRDVDFYKAIYKKVNRDMSKYCWTHLWGIKKYSLIEGITKWTIFTKSLFFYLVVILGGLLLVGFDRVTFGFFSLFVVNQNVEWVFFVIIFTVDSIKSFSDTKKTDLKHKKITALDVIIKIIIKGNFVEYIYLFIFTIISAYFFAANVAFIYVLTSAHILLNTSISFNNKILGLSAIFVIEFLLIYYIINLKIIIKNFVTNDEKIPKYNEFLSTFVILLPVMYSIDKEKSVYFIISLLCVSIIIANNYIYRKYIKCESLSISKKTSAIFGIIGVIFIVAIQIDLSLLLSAIILLFLIKFVQIMFSHKEISTKRLQKRYKDHWNYRFWNYIMISILYIMVVIHWIYNSRELQYPIFYKILSIGIFFLILIIFIFIDMSRKKLQHTEIELIKDDMKRMPVILRICGIDGPFLK